MFKHYLVPNLIGAYKQQCCIPLIGLLMFMVGSQSVHPQQGIALDAYAIFEQSCLICHGPDGAYKENTLNGTQRTHYSKRSRCSGQPGSF